MKTPAAQATPVFPSGVVTHEIDSPRQGGVAKLHVLKPDADGGRRGMPVLYLLPVEK